jgi:uncharacterized protein YegP (UPF0339 family)
MGLFSFLFGKKKRNKEPVPDTVEVVAEVEEVVDENTVAPEDADDPVTVETVTESKATKSGRFDIKRTKDGRFVFNLYSANKVLIATSQTYSSSQSAMAGVKSVMANAARAEIEDTTLKTPRPASFPKWEVYLDKASEYRYRLYATNGQCVVHSKMGYPHKTSCKRAIQSIVRLAEDANIDKSYLGK